MLGDTWPYRILLVAVAVIGIAALVVGSVGLYTVLTGGTADGPPEVDVLGEYDCESFEGDPEVAHQASYGIDRTLLSGNAIASVNATDTDDGGFRMEIELEGGLLGASARRADGTNVSVERVDDEDRVVVRDAERTPFRLWIDSVSEDATVTRTRLDVCPPERGE